VNIFHEFRAFVRLWSTKSASIHPFTALIAGVISTVAGECLKVEINFSLQLEKILAKLEPAKAYLGTGQTLKLVDQYPDAHPVVKKALNIIEEGYASDLSQSDVAERLGITAEYFSYIFAKSTGKSYTKFLRAYRINKAMDILSKDPDKKNDVCLMVGFRDQKYFAKCFKEVTGKPLSEYLQEIGE